MSDLGQLPAELRAVRTRPLFTMTLTVAPFHDIGGPAGARRRVSEVTGGSFAGDRLSGEVLPGGTDWQTIRDDGTALLDARLVLRADDGALIAMTYPGIRHGPPDVLAAIGRGEAVDPASYYFRIAPSFTTSAPHHDWLNRILAVGVGHRLAVGPVYSIFEIL